MLAEPTSSFSTTIKSRNHISGKIHCLTLRIDAQPRSSLAVLSQGIIELVLSGRDRPNLTLTNFCRVPRAIGANNIAESFYYL
jgi:hypothetical protein